MPWQPEHWSFFCAPFAASPTGAPCALACGHVSAAANGMAAARRTLAIARVVVFWSRDRGTAFLFWQSAAVGEQTR
jgi:hypothetical protein